MTYSGLIAASDIPGNKAGDDRLGTGFYLENTPMWAQDLSDDQDRDGLSDTWEAIALGSLSPALVFDEGEESPIGDPKILSRITPFEADLDGDKHGDANYIIFIDTVAFTKDFGKDYLDGRYSGGLLDVLNPFFLDGTADHNGDTTGYDVVWKIIDNEEEGREDYDHLTLTALRTKGHTGKKASLTSFRTDLPDIELTQDGKIKIYIEEDKHGTWASLKQRGDAAYNIGGGRTELANAYNIGEPFFHPEPHFTTDLNQDHLFPRQTDKFGNVIGSDEDIWNDTDGRFCGGYECDVPNNWRNALIGSVVGGIIGGPVGLVTGAVAGGLFGKEIEGASPGAIAPGDNAKDGFRNAWLNSEKTGIFENITKLGLDFHLDNENLYDLEDVAKLNKGDFSFTIQRLQPIDEDGIGSGKGSSNMDIIVDINDIRQLESSREHLETGETDPDPFEVNGSDKFKLDVKSANVSEIIERDSDGNAIRSGGIEPITFNHSTPGQLYTFVELQVREVDPGFDDVLQLHPLEPEINELRIAYNRLTGEIHELTLQEETNQYIKPLSSLEGSSFQIRNRFGIKDVNGKKLDTVQFDPTEPFSENLDNIFFASGVENHTDRSAIWFSFTPPFLGQQNGDAVELSMGHEDAIQQLAADSSFVLDDGTVLKGNEGFLKSNPNETIRVHTTIKHDEPDITRIQKNGFIEEFSDLSILHTSAGSGNDKIILDTPLFSYLKGDDGDDEFTINDTLEQPSVGSLWEGGNGSDTLAGGYGKDVFYGDGGDDYLFGEAGDDEMRGGTGDDYISTALGNDLAFGNSGNDEIYTGSGHDVASGGIGHDVIQTDSGDDIAFAGLGDDIVITGQGDDLVLGDSPYTDSAYQAIIRTNAGNDIIDLGTGNDIGLGEGGHDEIYGGSGLDLLFGGSGNDTIDGGNDIDTVSYYHDPTAVNVNLTTETATDGFGDQDTVIDVENVIGSSFDDVITGDNVNNLIAAGAGHDTVYGGDGDDRLFGEAGNDHLLGEAGDDVLNGGPGNDILDGGEGFDWASYDNASGAILINLTTGINTGSDGGDTLINIEGLEGSKLSDRIFGDALDNWFSGLDGNDILDGRGGDDILLGGDGRDRIIGGDGNDILNGDAGNDSLDGDDGNDELDGGDGDDDLDGGNGQDTLKGGSGDDFLNGGNDNDDLLGGAGIDFLDGDEGNDLLNGGDGHDVIYGAEGDDTLLGEAGDDYLEGGIGQDTFLGGTGNDILDGGDGDDFASFKDASGSVTINLSNETYSSIPTSSLPIPDVTIAALSAYDGHGTTDSLNSIEIAEGSVNDDMFISSEADETLIGNAGNDFFVINGGSNTVDGGDGIDTVDYRSSTTGMTIDLAEQTATNITGVKDTLSSIENAIGSRFDDTILGEDGGHTLDGDAGNDTLAGGLGDDEIFGGDGDDLIRGDLNRRDTQDEINGGNDILHGGKGNDRIGGKTGDDQLYGDEGNDELWGGLGDDLLVGGQGEDILTGLTGADTFRFNSFNEGPDTITDFDQLQGDKLEILGTGFADDLVKGVLSADAFVLGSSALDANDRFIYDQSTGSLFFDADGSGAQAAVQVATLSNSANLTHNDIQIV